MTERIKIGIVGGSGYTGGELLRLLLHHPHADVTQVTSNSNAGRFVHQIHPHLRGQCTLKFTTIDSLEACDLLFLAMPHGEAQKNITQFADLAERIIDLSADFRLRSPDLYRRFYGEDHAAPEWLEKFMYGLPEINRRALEGAQYASGVGCNATATNLATFALVEAGLIKDDMPLVADIKVGSSEAGNKSNASSHHPVRVGIVRPFQLTGHRHEAEVVQAMEPFGAFDVRISVTSVELVRGISAMVHVTLPKDLPERDLWSIYRSAWGAEPFIRVIHERQGIHRHPEPRLLAGTNFADVGWDYDPATGRAVLLCALDNLGKGAAGSAVQCMNLMRGFDEDIALNFGGFFP